MNEAKNVTKHICTKCNKKFRSVQGLISHTNKKTSCTDLIRCVRCNKVFKTRGNLAQHKNRKTSCDKQFLEEEKELMMLKHKLELEKLSAKKEIELIETELKHKLALEKIQLQKEKELAVEEIKKLRKGIGSTAIYIISNAEHIEKNKYKIGKTSDGKAHLQTKYQRYLCGATVLLYLELDSADTTERTILNHFKDKRQKTPTGRLNEWICEDLDIIKSYITEIVA